MHLLLAPAALAELHRQPVEQIPCIGIFALHAEILGGLDEAGAEEGLPEAVDLHPGGQRMLRVEEPLGKAEPVGRRSVGSGGRKAGVAKLTFSSGCSGSRRGSRICVSRGLASSITMTRGSSSAL